ncbi:uncharacterized protein LOC113770926 [Coffea eugenioides]|uniref:IST1-like protein n=1 Tax=Coffea arabica TaxID=13443 RepID=A0A6P6XIQ0_COFAR|nr:uncharacterized protein LOC113743698 [Coffea arabica]XP_027171353.1 uncharacterized protein LOC113770926 [Coffea eugenioides]
MFDILFGWRKASKCKKLIRRVQCRLKILKNKQSTIVRQSREDLAELLKHGHAQTAFDRVEQLFKDECKVAAYDLLDQFCEFIILNLSYIRRNRDCPNDINEAVSSLIFASARVRSGDLPELLSIRKLFGEWYGQRLATSALELLPGNLVNRQIAEKLSIKSVPDDVKSSLVKDILGSSLQSGPLLLEYSSEKQQKLANESSGDPFPSAETIREQNEGHNLQMSNATEEGKIVYVDFSSVKKSIKDLSPSLVSSMTTFPSTYSVVLQQTLLKTVDSTVHKKDLRLVSSARKICPCAFEMSSFQQLEGAIVVHDSAVGQEERSAVVESSSVGQLPKEMIYLDDIQEIQSPLSKEGNLQDQRLFKFKQSALPVTGITQNPDDEAPDQEQYDSDNERAASRSFRQSRNMGSGKRQRRRSVSGDATSMNDIECAIYYGESYGRSPNYYQKSRDKKKDQKKVPIKRQQKVYQAQEIPMHSPFIKVKSGFNFIESNDDHTKSDSRCSSDNKMLNNCSLQHPCYFRTCDDEDDWNCSPQKPKIQYVLCHCHCSCSKNPKIKEAEKGMLLNQPTIKSEDATSPPFVISTSSGANSPFTSKEGKPSYSRAMTMPPERPKDAGIDSMLRSNSFPFEHPESSSNRHVHPKLPDYDELAAKFMALKKAYLQK